MNTERFLSRCNEDPIYLDSLNDSIKEKTKYGEMPVSAFAEMFIDKSSQALIEKSKQIENDQTSYLDEDFGTELRNLAPIEYMSVIYGNIIIGLEKTNLTGQLGEMTFDLKTMIDSINTTFDESGARRITEPEKYLEIHEFNQAEKEKFNSIFNRGKNYTSFFRHPSKSLPRNLVEYFKEDEDEFNEWMMFLNNKFKPAMNTFIKAYRQDRYEIGDYYFSSDNIKKFKDLKEKYNSGRT